MLQGESPPPPLLHSLGFRQLRSGLLPLQTIFRPSLRRPKWVLLIQSRPKWVLIVLQTTCRGPTDAKPEVDPSGSCSSRVDPSGSCSSCRRPAGDLQTPSLGRPKWVLLVLRRPKGVLRRPKGVLIVQSRPQWVLVAQSSTLLSLVRLGDGLLTRLRVPRTTHLAGGGGGGVVIKTHPPPPPPPRKRRRLSGNSSDEDPSSQNRQQRDDRQDEDDNFRPASLDLLLNYINKKFPAASQPLVQPSSKWLHVMESAGLVDESFQQFSNLAWFGHMRSACDYAQR